MRISVNCVAVVANGYVRGMLSMVRKLSKKAGEKMELAPTLEEARALAYQRLREAERNQA